MKIFEALSKEPLLMKFLLNLNTLYIIGEAKGSR
ncbi:hypothetical protein PT2222_180076 [Paraburkholderia tropica]